MTQYVGFTADVVVQFNVSYIRVIQKSTNYFQAFHLKYVIDYKVLTLYVIFCICM